MPARAGAVTAPVQALNDALLRAMRQGAATPFEKRYQMLSPVIRQSFDLQAVLAMVVGVRWKELPPDQQQALLAAFSRFTVSTYVANFDGYDGQKFTIVGTHPQGDRQVVESNLIGSDGKPTAINYVMHDEGGAWRAVDVLLDGTISRTAVMRADFRSLLSSGNAAALIANLDRKSADLASGQQH